MKTGSYRPQLDGLRALAVLAVVFQHFAPSAWSRVIPWGGLGVTLFFVLSGYLITGILLRGRAEGEKNGSRRRYFLSHFYIRRALRIFPVYYATLIVAAILAIPPVRETFWWHAAYLSNVLFAWKNSYFGSVSPFWSLAVEQHFYLIWPWIVLSVPQRRLAAVFIAAAISGLAFRLGIHAAGWNDIAVNVLTPTAFEPFGIGAFLAWIEFTHHENFSVIRRALRAGLLLMPMALWLAYSRPGSALQMVVSSLAWGPLFFWLVAGSARGFRGIGGRVLQSMPLVYFGKLSYGIYLMHNLVYSQIHPRWDGVFPGLRGLIALGVTLLLSGMSYEFLEAPVRKLKSVFPYHLPQGRSV